MLQLKIAIILQLTGALDALGGVALFVVSPKGAWQAGLVLVLIGTVLFFAGRRVLREFLRAKRTPVSNLKPAMATVPVATEGPVSKETAARP